MDVSDGSTDNYLLTGLQNRKNYNVLIVATSQHFNITAVTVLVGVGENINIHLVFISITCK